ncbi:MAG: site-2 protease family protein [Deltaproteobacteria bacterium]|jgi:Zn-dependent protease|nr:site-2 protease family protein [Deltaproteobacteria bacterium]
MFTLSISTVLLLILPLLVSLAFHEFCHALVATFFGDYTAKDRGRLTLNPLAHLDIMGTLFIVFTGLFGWAKPVPVNPLNFKHPARDMAFVAAAGPLSNLSLAVILSFILKFTVFNNLIYKLPQFFSDPVSQMLLLAFYLNLGLFLFNLLPFPPLDGFRIVAYFLPRPWLEFCEKYSFVFFLILMGLVFTSVLNKPLYAIIQFFERLLLG